MAYTLYIHEPADALPRLARRGFPPGSFLSTDLDWVIEDALFEAGIDLKPHAVIELRVPEEFLAVTEEEILEAIQGKEEEWEEWEEGAEVEEGRAEAGEEFWEGEPDPETIEAEAMMPEAAVQEVEEWPQTMEEAIDLTETATLVQRLLPPGAVVLGIPKEIVMEEQTPEEAATDAWYRFDIDPVPLADFRRSFFREMFRRVFRRNA